MSTETNRQPEVLVAQTPPKSDAGVIILSVAATMIAAWLFSEWAADRNPVTSLTNFIQFILR